jgi:hypothetical protein
MHIEFLQIMQDPFACFFMFLEFDSERDGQNLSGRQFLKDKGLNLVPGSLSQRNIEFSKIHWSLLRRWCQRFVE